jgi:hypothetical protein
VCIQHDRAAAAAEQRSQEREQTKTLEGGVGKEENGRESKEERWVLDTFSPEPERTEQNRTEKAKPSTVIDQVAGEPAAYQTLFFFRCWLQVRLCVSLSVSVWVCSCVRVVFSLWAAKLHKWNIRHGLKNNTQKWTTKSFASVSTVSSAWLWRSFNFIFNFNFFFQFLLEIHWIFSGGLIGRNPKVRRAEVNWITAAEGMKLEFSEKIILSRLCLRVPQVK